METTLNIRNDILSQISKFAKINGVSRSKMIAILIKKIVDNINDPERPGRMIRYQDRCRPGESHTFHVYMQKDDYEYWLDLKKLLKMSVSLILAFAVKKYLIKGTKISRTDNYRFINYSIVKEVAKNSIIWKIVWGIPPNLRK